jgi:hypothetical protein
MGGEKRMCQSLTTNSFCFLRVVGESNSVQSTPAETCNSNRKGSILVMLLDFFQEPSYPGSTYTEAVSIQKWHKVELVATR